MKITKQNAEQYTLGNTILGPAIHLCEKYGFERFDFEQGHYTRSSINMEKRL